MDAAGSAKSVADAIYFRHGRYWTSAGVTAGIDMALGMVEADRGRDIASIAS